MLKSCGVGGWVVVVAYSILVSAHGPLVLGLGPGLDNYVVIYENIYNSGGFFTLRIWGKIINGIY